ncbi:hypothetical protein Q4511_00610 [Paracoccus sp. 1_MG-2023]|uniref:hypothetical protein n=1 Tax=unclassified Paracoccus (in: a-proteobacteria) TaxID=2688777 RepID=UPI001C090F3D|nr:MULTISPECIES: hypothetical protein [unclassified Paracoccus (in: a-proteobacteria)]MBU2957741.1 hypothetical protein [Paracoccus sp. C2R09]MDO6667411.1 hypothetical protein [Paracoccus sp. 1_MG-2023]
MTRPLRDSMADPMRQPALPRVPGNRPDLAARHRRDARVMLGRDEAAWESRIELFMGGM